MQGFVRLCFSFCWKAIKSMSLLSSFSFQDSSWLAILYKQLLSNHGRKTKQTSGLINNMVALITLCGKEIKQSHFIVRGGRFWIEIQPCKDNLVHTSGTPSGHSQTTVDLSFRLVDSATLPDYRAPRPNLVPRSRSVAQHKNKTYPYWESERYIHSPVQSATRLAAYHIYGMWLVLSKT